MPYYNGERYVAEALRSVFSQTYRNFEVVVVDDGSTRESSERLRAILSDIGGPALYVRQPNGGIASAYNAGIRRCRGELVSFIEQDDFWLPGKLAADVGYLAEHPEAGMVFSRYRIADSGGQYDARICSALALSGRCFAALFATTLSGATILPFSAVTVRRAVLEHIGPLDERLRISVDYSTWLRVSFRNEIGFIDAPMLVYRTHDGNASRNALVALEDDRRIIEEWAADEGALAVIGREAVKKRLFRLYGDLAFAYAKAGEPRAERRIRARRVLLRPLAYGAWLGLIAAWVPSSARRFLAWHACRVAAVARSACRALLKRH